MPYADPGRQRQYQRERVAALRQAWLDENGPCAACGSRENLEVDHRDRATKVTHRVWSWSADRRAAELAKCQVLCAHCHDQKGHMDGTYESVRGERNGQSRLSAVNVAAIRERRQAGETYASIAADFGVCISQIRNVAKGYRWK